MKGIIEHDEETFLPINVVDEEEAFSNVMETFFIPGTSTFLPINVMEIEEAFWNVMEALIHT